MNTKIILWALYGLILILIILSGLQYYHLTNEDAWISFKYARNLADGYGLVSNPGDVTQEGYSNLVLVLLLAFFRWAFNAEIVHTAKIIGLSSLIGIILLTPAMLRLLLTALERYLIAGGGNNQTLAEQFIQRKTLFFHAISLLLIASIGLSQYMSYWATQGLETTLYTLIVWSITYLTLQVVLEHRYEKIWIIAILSFISLNTRPEGLMNFFVSGGVIFIAALIEKRLNWQTMRTLLNATAIFLILVAILMTFKYLYFGDILANPSYMKLAVSVWAIPSLYFSEYFNAKGIAFTTLAAFALTSGLFVSLRLFKTASGRAIISSITIFIAFLSSQVFFIFYVGNDYMAYSRFIITHYPLLILAIVWCLIILIHRIIAMTVIVAGILVVTSAIQEIDRNTILRWHQLDYVSPLEFHKKTNSGYYFSVEKINQRMANNPGYYAASEFGYVPYHVTAKGLDMMALNQKEIARHFKLYSLEEVFYANRDFILSKKPITIVTGHYYRKPNGDIFLEPAVSWFFKSYIESPFFWQNYTTQVPNKKSSEYYWIFSDWNDNFKSTHTIQFGDTEHYDKLMHGFHIENSQIWTAPLARVLLKRRTSDKFFNLEGYIPDITNYPNQENVIEIRLNNKAVGDRLFAQKAVKHSGEFAFKILLDYLVFREEDTLITLRGSKFDAPSDNRKLSYLLRRIYFSKK